MQMTGWKQKPLLLLMLLTLTGGQWALLQSVAWAGMLVSRARTERLQQAVISTFDGKHPCPLCDAVQKGRKSENKPEVVAKFPRIEFPPGDPIGIQLECSTPHAATIPDNEFAESLRAVPLLRPPRSIFL